jgi:aerobic-type carbon monoxide dehydrogenase small subunit (CoxS/CutS family)
MPKAKIQCVVNKRPQSFDTEPDRTLLEVLREDLQMTGTKYGCGEGACGACSVLLDGQRVFSCSTPVSEAEGREITTLEGIAQGQDLHPVQQAFLDEGAFQCGYCTAGMVMNAVSLLSENPDPTDEQIAQGMNENVCRCCGYPGMLRAVRRAADAMRQEVTP